MIEVKVSIVMYSIGMILYRLVANAKRTGYTSVLVMVLKKNSLPRTNAPAINKEYTSTLITTSSGTAQNAFNATAIPAVPPTSNLFGITKNATAKAMQKFPISITKISKIIFFNLFLFIRLLLPNPIISDILQ